MVTYKELQIQIAELEMKAQEARASETGAAIAQIQAMMRELDIAIEDLESGTTKKARKPTPKAEIKFRSGEKTWSGRGRMPLWLKGENREKYRVA